MELKTRSNTFRKNERLYSRSLIEQLFAGQSTSFTAWPLRVVFLLVDDKKEQSASNVELLISVSKRYFKHAVDRNRVKRQVREAYRTNKELLQGAMSGQPGKRLLVAMIWQDAHLHSSAKVGNKVQVLLRRVAEKLGGNE